MLKTPRRPLGVSVPASAPATPPETGASSIGWPCSAAAAWTARAVSTSMVEQSISTVPRSVASMIPSARNTVRTSVPAGNLVMTKSPSKRGQRCVSGARLG
jgi:hypothetical protein